MVILGRKQYYATLEFVNIIRIGYGAEPLDKLPRGQRLKPGHCVIANALKDVKGILWSASGPWNTVILDRDKSPNLQTIDHPPTVQRFVEGFDLGLRRSLIER